MELSGKAHHVLDDFFRSIPVERRDRFVPDRKALYIIACSGGLDSGTLSVIYCYLHRSGFVDHSPVLFHLNHRLRLSAYRDERFVEDLGRSLDMPVYVERRPVGPISRRMGLNLEEAGRLLRYRCMARLAKSMSPGFRDVYGVTAHHAGDYAETLLLKILRGATDNAFRMPDLSEMSIKGGSLSLLRPLLFLDRSELEELANQMGMRFREDPSNRSDAYLRNRLRSRVIPALREEGFRPGALWLRVHGTGQRFGRNLKAPEKNEEEAIEESMEEADERAHEEGIERANEKKALKKSEEGFDPKIVSRSAFSSYLRLPLDFLQGADANELKPILDRALRRIGCPPVQGSQRKGTLAEILRQSSQGRILLKGPGFLLASSLSSLWVFREDCILLQTPLIQATDGDADGYRSWTIRSPSPVLARGARDASRVRTFLLPATDAMALPLPGLRTASGKKASELFQELDVPVPLRSCIPVQLRKGFLTRICLSWIGDRSDFLVST